MTTLGMACHMAWSLCVCVVGVGAVWCPWVPAGKGGWSTGHTVKIRLTNIISRFSEHFVGHFTLA